MKRAWPLDLEVLIQPGTGYTTRRTPKDVREGQELECRARKGRPKLVALGLEASKSSRRWPPERFLDTVCNVGAAGDVAFLASGGSDVIESARWLAKKACGLVTCAGDDLPLGTVWAAIANCNLSVGNDTGLMHMAAAARVPVVAVIGAAAGAPVGTRGHPSHTGPMVLRSGLCGLRLAYLQLPS